MSDDPTKDIGEKLTTQPTIQTVLERLAEFQVAVERRFDSLETNLNERFDRIESRLKSLERKLDILNKDLLDIRADLADMDERITTLESK